MVSITNDRRMLIVQAAALVTAMYALLFSRLRMAHNKRPRITYAPMSQRDKERQTYLNKIYSNDVECVNQLRMRTTLFFELCNLLSARALLKDSIHSSVEEQVAMFLHVVGHNQRFRVIHQSFVRYVETVSRYFKEVLFAIGELRDDMIKAPSNETSLKISSSSRWYPYFKDCVGAIDGTHVRARVPTKIAAAFRGRKHYTTHMPGFSEEALMFAFSHLVDNKAQGTAFVGMTDAHRVLWLSTFLSKHYYM